MRMGIKRKNNKYEKREEYITCLMTIVLDTRFAHNSIASLHICVHVGFIYPTWFNVLCACIFASVYSTAFVFMYLDAFIYLFILYSLCISIFIFLFLIFITCLSKLLKALVCAYVHNLSVSLRFFFFFLYFFVLV